MLKRAVAAAALALAWTTMDPLDARGDTIKVWTARAIATVLAEIGQEFERTTGHRLEVSSDLPNGFQRRMDAGEHADLLISASARIDDWIKTGKVVSTTRTEMARSHIGVAVRAGSPKPDISTVEKFKQALLDAKSIAYLRVGSGIYLTGLFDRLGVAKALEAKTTRPESDIVCELVAKGEIQLGLVVITQILTTPGVELAGPLPSEIQSFIVFTAGVTTNAKAPDAALQLVKFLKSPAALAVIRKQGMEPAQ
jgi:molybdate transport system substrate-binding protein